MQTRSRNRELWLGLKAAKKYVYLAMKNSLNDVRDFCFKCQKRMTKNFVQASIVLFRSGPLGIFHTLKNCVSRLGMLHPNDALLPKHTFMYVA